MATNEGIIYMLNQWRSSDVYKWRKACTEYCSEGEHTAQVSVDERIISAWSGRRVLMSILHKCTMWLLLWRCGGVANHPTPQRCPDEGYPVQSYSCTLSSGGVESVKPRGDTWLVYREVTQPSIVIQLSSQWPPSLAQWFFMVPLSLGSYGISSTAADALNYGCCSLLPWLGMALVCVCLCVLSQCCTVVVFIFLVIVMMPVKKDNNSNKSHWNKKWNITKLEWA